MSSTLSGILFLLVGNSGSGKDTLLRWALDHWPEELPPVLVPQRAITRPPSPDTEDFRSVTPEEFKDMSENGEFALQWVSYDLEYGVPKSIDDHLAQGYPVVANVSRDIIPEARQKYTNLKVIFVHVPFEMLEERLESRGREKDEDIERRLSRAQMNQDLPDADFVVENVSTVDEGGQQLLDVLISAVKEVS
jgi:ribose 1,5-bisphosphokinase